VSVAAALGLPVQDVLDLAVSLNPVAPDLRILVASTLASLRHYPDLETAREELSSCIGVPSSQLLLTNGGSEAISLVAAELRRGWVVEPDFSLYRRYLGEIAPDAGRWLSNPNNPTGRLVADGEVAAVFDEAFYPLACGRWTRGDHLRGSVVVGSLTKVLSCPGLRLGYVISTDEELIGRLARRQPEWSVSSVAAASLPPLLELVDLPAFASSVAALRSELVGMLGNHGIKADPSDANFVLVRDVPGLRERLAHHAVLVRDCASFGLPGAVRIAVPDDRGLERLETALQHLDGVSSRRSARRVHRQQVPPASIGGGLLVCGTSSDAGKSQFVAGLCRLLARRGVKVAPFKAQNMSLNSYATRSGHEISRAQAMQAMAAGIDPEPAMNPVLLKPVSSGMSQVVVMGEPLGEIGSRGYLATRRAALLPAVLAAFSSLRERFDVVICEGAGSPAEINLLEGDIVNLRFADAVGIPALMVGDIDRGGVFASLVGTHAVLPDVLRRRVRAFVINKLRGDPEILAGGLERVEEMTHWRCLGVLPHLGDLTLEAEDSLGLERLISSQARADAVIDVAVVALPHMANFTDLDALCVEPAVSVRTVAEASQLGRPDLLILPGSKSTVADLSWMRSEGLAEAVRAAADDPDGPVVLGICAGYQMLGRFIDDDYESRIGRVEALGLLPVATRFSVDKRSRQRRGEALACPIVAYEIHQGEVFTLDPSDSAPFAQLDDAFGIGPEGCSVRGGKVAGTALHGLFESDSFRAAYLGRVWSRGNASSEVPIGRLSYQSLRESQIDRVADAMEECVDVAAVMQLIAEPSGALA
jgi:adenosylcobyric acid synthase